MSALIEEAAILEAYAHFDVDGAAPTEERPHVHVPIAHMPSRETIALGIFPTAPSWVSRVRDWVPEQANRWISGEFPIQGVVPPAPEEWTEMDDNLRLLASEAMTNVGRYGIPKRKADRLVPVEVAVVTEPGHDGNIVAAFGDLRYNMVRSSTAAHSSRGLDLSASMAVQMGFDRTHRRPTVLHGVHGRHPVEVDKAFWFEVGPRSVPEHTVFVPPQRRAHAPGRAVRP